VKSECIAPSRESITSAILCVPKPGATNEDDIRVVWDLRKFNESCNPFVYPMPSTTEVLDEVKEGVYWS
jgi:hypothetical protein